METKAAERLVHRQVDLPQDTDRDLLAEAQSLIDVRSPVDTGETTPDANVGGELVELSPDGQGRP